MIGRPPRPEQRVRRVLCQVVEEQPGIHFRELEREAHVSSNGQLRHHLDRLLHDGKLLEVKDGRYRRYFLAGQHDRHLRPGLTHFARRVPRRIARVLLKGPHNRTELRRTVGCADSTLGYHLRRMAELGYLQKERSRNACSYSLVDPEFVRSVLLVRSLKGFDETRNITADRPGNVDHRDKAQGSLKWLVAREAENDGDSDQEANGSETTEAPPPAVPTPHAGATPEDRQGKRNKDA